jgi:DNA-binding GntR family transcriptional regulator
MPDLSASERAYGLLKQDIITGALPSGPIDLRRVSDRFRMSVTPVREALARLSAERLVRQSPNHGYAIAPPSAQRLEHLYDLASILVDLSLTRALPRSTPPPIVIEPASDYPRSFAALLDQVAAAQSNLELRDQVAGLNDRLHLARRFEPEVFDHAEADLKAVWTLWTKDDLAHLRARLGDMHQSRIRQVDAIARVLAERTGNA